MDKLIRVTLFLCAMLLMSPALANQHDPALDEVLSFPDFTLLPPAQGGQPAAFTVPAGSATHGNVVGISFSGTVDIAEDDHAHTRASDMCLIVQAPDGSRYAVGGRYVLSNCYPTGALGSVGPPGTFENGVRPWAFQRATQDGTYHSAHQDAFAAVADSGNWTFTFVHDHHHAIVVGMDWSAVKVTLHKTNNPFQPEPGAPALWRNLDLGFAQAGKTTSPVRTNRLINTAGGGGSPIELASIGLVGDPEIQLVSSTCSGSGSLAPEKNCGFVFNCSPSAAAVFKADLVVALTDGRQVKSNLTCTGLRQPPMVIVPSRHSFGRIDPNGIASFDFTVTNNSGVVMFFSGQGLAPAKQFSFNSANCSQLAAGASCTLPVTFAPNGSEGSWVTTLRPWFWTPATLGAFNEVPFDVSGTTTGVRRLVVLATPPILLPANGSMRPVQVSVVKQPQHPPAAECAISNVSSNQGLGIDDYQITEAMSLNLRAKHLGAKEGRVYTIEVTCSGGGEEHIGTTQVHVPNHSRR